MNRPTSNNRNDDGDIDLNSVKFFIQEEQRRLEEEKLKIERLEIIKKRRSDGNHNLPLQNIALPEKTPNNELPNNEDINDQIKEKNILRDSSTVFMIRNSREEEINKLIDKISKPKERQSFTNNKELNRSFPQVKSSCSHFHSYVNIREKEKDQLSEKLASSESPITKPSCRQIAKNLYSSITFNDCKENNLVKSIDKEKITPNLNKIYHYATEKNINDGDREEYLRAKYNHPKIVISQYNENQDFGESKDSKMVRIGEFSPLNPNLPGGATVIGLGEWDEKRQYLLEKYRQPSRSPSPSPCESDHSHNQRSIATQTDLSDDWSPNITLEKRSQQTYQAPEQGHSHTHEDDDRRCTSPQLRMSPIPKCFENMTEKEVKELIYRQELQKQIEEKNRLKEELKRREAEEEAKIEAKIQRDLEKMRRQYEEERLQRLELAIKKREQEDFFRQRFAIEQEKGLQENRTPKKRPVKDSALQDYTFKKDEKSTQSDFERPKKATTTRVPYSRSLPERSAASALHSVRQDLQQPLLGPSTNFSKRDGFLSKDKSVKHTTVHEHKTKQLSINTSSIPPAVSVNQSKEVDILTQQAVFDTNTKLSPRLNNETSFPSDVVKDKLKEVDNILKQPLLPESHKVLPPVSQPLIHATIPPLSSSLHSPRSDAQSASTRNNAHLLEDKWKVPYVEPDTGAAPNTKHNARILTQLGTFRRQLQEESLRMRQRVREDSP